MKKVKFKNKKNKIYSRFILDRFVVYFSVFVMGHIQGSVWIGIAFILIHEMIFFGRFHKSIIFKSVVFNYPISYVFYIFFVTLIYFLWLKGFAQSLSSLEAIVFLILGIGFIDRLYVRIKGKKNKIK